MIRKLLICSAYSLFPHVSGTQMLKHTHTHTQAASKASSGDSEKHSRPSENIQASPQDRIPPNESRHGSAMNLLSQTEIRLYSPQSYSTLLPYQSQDMRCRKKCHQCWDVHLLLIAHILFMSPFSIFLPCGTLREQRGAGSGDERQ